ncbi:MAG: heavy metal transporter [Burkholderiales bacterium RIFCSPHIGHO2_12_FULL_61_11]|nr:MAG: heavy metal transporter [Burkholderiales bacterium RIFCSPHIGHO2_12_FULL_61_11]
MEFDIPAISCSHCIKAITETVKALDPEAKISVDIASKKMTLETSKDRLTVVEALTEAGYPTC